MKEIYNNLYRKHAFFYQAFSSFFMLFKLLHWLLPYQCPCCHLMIDNGPGLCPTCWDRFDFINNDSVCDVCGHPVDILEKDPFCPFCLKPQHLFSKARSCFVYDDHSKKVILTLKHNDGLFLAPFLGNLLYRTYIASNYEGVDAVVPIPLHWKRLLARQYNQAGLLAKELCKRANLPFKPELLRRHKHTLSQGHKTANERKLNLHEAFRVPQKIVKDVRGKHILLIDDVWTTGATLMEACRTLKKSGASQISILTLARVVHTFKNQIV